MKLALFAALTATLVGGVYGGPISYGICQAGCAVLVVACYSSAGLVFGTVTAGAGAPAAALVCNSAFGTCQTACIAAGCAPVP